MKGITILALPVIGTTAAFAATDDGAAHGRVHARHGADDPAAHHRHDGSPLSPYDARPRPTGRASA